MTACPTGPDDDDASAAPGDDDDLTPGPDDDDGADDDDDLPDSFDVTVLVTRDGAPLEGVAILQGGGDVQGTTDAAGTFTATMDGTVEGEVWVVASLEDHRAQGAWLDAVPEGIVSIELATVQSDNADYTFAPPGDHPDKTTEYCSHCHVRLTEQFNASAHSGAANDPEVHDVFAGAAHAFEDEDACLAAGGRWLAGTLPGGEAGDRCYLGGGLLPDATDGCGGDGEPACDDPDRAGGLPEITGACADCHAPGVDGPAGGGHSLLEVAGLAFEAGVHCDVCHKVRAIDPDGAPGAGGRLVFGRPHEEGGAAAEFLPVMYGPYRDVLNFFMGGAYAPHFEDASLCSGCHQHEQEPLWDDVAAALDPARWPDGVLPIQSTYAEWTESPLWSSSNCQTCHMPPVEAGNAADIDLFGSLPPGVAGGFLRAHGDVRDHSFYGPLATQPEDPPLIETAASLSVEATWDADAGELVVGGTLANSGAGHGLPTGEPLRSVVLRVAATCDEGGDVAGAALVQASGPTLTDVSGRLAEGVVGTGGVASADRGAGAGTAIDWPAADDVLGAAAVADPSALVVRAVRPTGGWVDYEGYGPFGAGEGTFAADGKGWPEVAPVGWASVVAIDGDGLELGSALTLEAGDVVFVGHAAEPADGEPAVALAGAAGMDFARVLADAAGVRLVHHYAAADVVRDNRLVSGAGVTPTWRFALPGGCTSATATATLLYRRAPVAFATARGWDNPDHLMDEETATAAAP